MELKVLRFRSMPAGLNRWETLLEENPALWAEEPILWIGRPASGTGPQKGLFPDLLGLDRAGNLILVELIPGCAPRNFLAQSLEQAAWASGLTRQDLELLAGETWKRRGEAERTLEEAFRETFLAASPGAALPQFNQDQRLVIVAQEVDPHLTQVLRYLQKPGALGDRCILRDLSQAFPGDLVARGENAPGEASGTCSDRRGQTPWQRFFES